MKDMEYRDPIFIEDAKFIYRTNFAGDPDKDKYHNNTRRGNLTIPNEEQALEMRDAGYNVKNTYTPVTIKFEGDKVWVDDKTHDNTTELKGKFILHRDWTVTDDSVETKHTEVVSDYHIDWDGNKFTIIAIPTGIVSATMIDETKKKGTNGRCPRCTNAGSLCSLRTRCRCPR